jgi:hypothetical protein
MNPSILPTYSLIVFTLGGFGPILRLIDLFSLEMLLLRDTCPVLPMRFIDRKF